VQSLKWQAYSCERGLRSKASALAAVGVPTSTALRSRARKGEDVKVKVIYPPGSEGDVYYDGTVEYQTKYKRSPHKYAPRSLY
jgi:hypothetical protein